MKTKGYFASRAAVAAMLLVGGALSTQAAMACQLTAWNGGLSPTNAPTPGSPSPDGIARYAGLCAMQAADGAVSYVQDNSPGGITRIVARFYVLANNSEDAIVYEGLDGTSTVFDVTVAADGAVTLSSGSQNISTAGNAGKWNSIEIDWTSGDALSLIVNGGNAATGTGAAAGTLDSVRLGNIDGAAGTLNFDAYESRRSTAVGRLCRGEVTGDGTRTNDDVLEIFNVEVASGGFNLVTGQPDFTEDGLVTNDDVLDLFNNVVSLGLGECP